MGRLMDMTGKEVNDFLCIRELGNEKVYVKCANCGKEFEAWKRSWRNGIITCKNLDCEKYYRDSKFSDMTGKEVNDFLCLKEFGYNRIFVKCVKCGKEFEARKDNWKKSRVACSNCGVQNFRFKLIEGHEICNIVVIKFAYLGRDNTPYYFCKDAKTDGKIEFPLSYTELFTYGGRNG